MRLTGGLLLLGIACLSNAAPAEPGATIDRVGLSAAILAETNRERTVHGLPPLLGHARLARAADGHTKFLVLIGGIRHESFLPGRHTVEDRVHAEGLRAARVSENLALVPLNSTVIRGKADGHGVEFVRGDAGKAGVDQLAAILVRVWMESPPHRENLLSPTFTHLGCAVQESASPAGVLIVYSAQVFARL